MFWHFGCSLLFMEQKNIYIFHFLVIVTLWLYKKFPFFPFSLCRWVCCCLAFLVHRLFIKCMYVKFFITNICFSVIVKWIKNVHTQNTRKFVFENVIKKNSKIENKLFFNLFRFHFNYYSQHQSCNRKKKRIVYYFQSIILWYHKEVHPAHNSLWQMTK